MTNLNTTSSVKIKKIRVGRGIGSGKGKTSGRGVKGQKSRSGVAIKSFEGGQMPLYRRLPKRGFNPIKKGKIAKINLELLEKLIDGKKITADNKIDLSYLKKSKILSKSVTHFKVLGNGELKSKLNIEADFSSKSAKEKIEKVGGSISVKNKKD
ncbi:MAG: 50S ribosomal protein L15 [Proteobacteria bacterium]|jgi:large subunit ribosomal protein L15|nr:50S ribosomal protein L15 [Pseudomonadota bacterium]|tara:strand:- start:1375 stop:1836 length:462 start_codon:yes stop_codon:yes gene_type:complete